ncbi:VOC family protein [Sphingobium sp. PNB]|uniref:VOC family protein n=1 Tax=Sphingobium sp. PNB TaxID=863934 RepID=UPI001CA3ACC6|nr:VOC family protein [Sphingobium sp. PNB]MCB4861520.1 VOC family protein [Sphingobium sp. PNB]
MMDRVDPIVRADAVVHVSFERRDIDAMARFLEDFGFVPVAGGSGGQRHFRGYGPQPYCVELIASERDAFVGFGLAARDRADLDRLSAATQAPVEATDAPGGGERVRLFDPEGVRVDLLWGAAPLEPLPVREPLTEVNSPVASRRIDRPVRTLTAPAPVFRIGHVVLQTPDFERTTGWYRRHFGYLPTDVATVGEDAPVLGFFRFDRGAEPADHHSLALLAGPESRLLHISTETIDVDAVGQGQQYLRGRGWNHYWGIGRHVLGGQVFDYWKDSAGDEWEHYADGDLMTADYPTGFHPLSRGDLWSWGDDLPDSMRPPAPAPADAPPLVRNIVDSLLVPPRPWLR